MNTKLAHIQTQAGIIPIIGDVLAAQAHSGLSYRVARADGKAWLATAHASLEVAGSPVSTNGTPCVISEVLETGHVPHQYLFAGVGATTQGSPHHPANPDNHNHPQVVVASDGHLIVVLTGHDSPIVVARSVEPGTIAAGFKERTLDIPQGNPNWGATYTALALVGDTLHMAYRSTFDRYSFDLCHVAVNTITLENADPVVIASPDERVPWGRGRKHQWYHDLVAVDGVLVVTGSPISGPTGTGGNDPNIIYYEPLRMISRDNGATWQ